jgi:hypothetical protein
MSIRKQPHGIARTVATKTPARFSAREQCRKDALEVDVEIDRDVGGRSLSQLASQLCNACSALVLVKYNNVVDRFVWREHTGRHRLDYPGDVNTGPCAFHCIDEREAVNDIAETGQEHNAYA